VSLSPTVHYPLGSMGGGGLALEPRLISRMPRIAKSAAMAPSGRGVFFTNPRNAGKTWKFSGAARVGQISTLRVHPSNPTSYMFAALGTPSSIALSACIYRLQPRRQDLECRFCFVSESAGQPYAGNPAGLAERTLCLHVAWASASRGPSSSGPRRRHPTRALMAAIRDERGVVCRMTVRAGKCSRSRRPCRIASTR